MQFLALAPPSDEDVKALVRRIAQRVRRLLCPRIEAAQADARPPDSLGLAQAESVSLLFGKPSDAGRAKKQAAYFDGFSLHAGVHLHANDRQGLLHLCGYGARPPLTQDRLSALPDGRLAYRLKRPLADGREVLLLQPLELLRRLATLVPPPRAHLVRYHGVFGPASAWREEVIPSSSASLPATDAGPLEPRPAAEPAAKDRPVASRIPWAELLLRVFREDVLRCPCGGRRKVVTFITERKVVQGILEHLGLPTTGPPIAPARAPALPESDLWVDDVPELQQSLR